MGFGSKDHVKDLLATPSHRGGFSGEPPWM